MTATQFKNAKRIWDALLELDRRVVNAYERPVWFTVGEVATVSGMSRPTAKRYLDAAVKEGAAATYMMETITLYTRIKKFGASK